MRSKEDFILTGRNYKRVAKISMANGLPSLRYRTVNMRMTLQFHSPSKKNAEIFTPLLMDHFRRWGLELHAGSYSPDKESKTQILFILCTTAFDFGSTKIKKLSMTLIWTI